MNGWLFYAVTAALNPTLLGATTVMLILDHPKRLLLGYLLGALMTSVTLGLVIVFSLNGHVHTAQHTLSPAFDLALGSILILVACVVRRGGRGEAAERLRERRRKRAKRGPPRWKRTLSQGSARTTFAVGAVLTLPGASYLIGLHKIDEQDASIVVTVGMVLLFNLVMMALLEVPLIGYVIAPDRTPDAVDRFRSWLSRNARHLAFHAALIVGALLIVRGLIYLL